VEPTAGTSSEQSRVVGPFVSALADDTPKAALATAMAPMTPSFLPMIPPDVADTPLADAAGR
jgi:hypothetical protein